MNTCLRCKHFSLMEATPGYSEMTPGTDFEMSCARRHWKFDKYKTDTASFRRMLSKANRCRDYRDYREGADMPGTHGGGCMGPKHDKRRVRRLLAETMEFFRSKGYLKPDENSSVMRNELPKLEEQVRKMVDEIVWTQECAEF